MDYVATILLAAKKAHVTGAVLLAICSHESGLNNVKVPHDGGSASYGICQVKYDTAQMLGYTGKPEGLMEPETNAKYAAAYLNFQFKRYDGNWCQAVAAYNAGRYNESKIMPGCPRNLKYVRHVQAKMDKKLKSTLACEMAENP
jgi:soluble lytic murein transglycosylase-like protein